MGEEPPGVSRRGLFGAFAKGLKDASAAAKEELRSVAPGRTGAEDASQASGSPPSSAPAEPAGPPAGPASASTTYPRRRRAPRDVVQGRTDMAGRVTAEVAGRPCPVGHALRVDAPGYADPFVLVRVGEDHWAAAVGTCPVDLSDVLFSAAQDRLWCPSCGSQWRMDGVVLRGPTKIALQSVHTEVLDGVARLVP